MKMKMKMKMKTKTERNTEKNRGNCISPVILFVSLFGLFWLSESPRRRRALMNFVLPWLKKEEEEKNRGRSSIMDDSFQKKIIMDEENNRGGSSIIMDEENDRGSSIIMDDDLKVLLPPEIITEILSRLPADSAIGCRGICKQWRSLIDHPSFEDTHTRQVISSSTSIPKKFGNYLIPNSSSSSSGFFLCAKQDEGRYKLEVIEYNEDEKSVVEFKPSKPITYHPFPFLCDTWGSLKISSCNGLVFMGSDKPNINTLVCNPFTREYVHLRIPTPLLLERNGYMAYGFGYLPSTHEYKVVSIYYDNVKTEEAGKNKGMVRVYTLGSGKWRNKGKIPCWIINTPFYSGGFANEAIHWFTENHKIVSFDLANEEFRLGVPLPPPARSPNYAVPLPPSARSPNYVVVQYGALGGCLCVTRSYRRAGRKEIWVLNVLTTNNNKEIKFSWNKKFSIPIWNKYNTDEATTPRVVTKSGKILLCGGSNSDLVSCDPKTEKFVFGKHFLPSKWVKVIPYTKSFVSLKALGEKDAKCFE